MHQREHNIIPTGSRWRFIALTLIGCLSTSLFTYPETAHAASMGKLMSLPGFVNLVAAIARTNLAMQQAAENPEDAWRRQAVHDAVAAMPAAIIGLAGEFQAGKLKNEDLPGVQAMLGGFIDVNAADGYKKFMSHPDKSLIPKTGEGFPQNIPAQPAALASAPSIDGFEPVGRLGDSLGQRRHRAGDSDPVDSDGESWQLGSDWRERHGGIHRNRFRV